MMISTGGKSAPLMADTSPSCFTMLAASVHQHTGTNDIGLEEDARIFDGAVNVGLCRKVDHDVSFAVANVGLHKAEIRVVHNRCQCGQIASVGQLVHADDPVIRILFQHVEHKITTNKTSTAGNNSIRDLFSSTLIYVFFTRFLINTDAFNSNLCQLIHCLFQVINAERKMA